MQWLFSLFFPGIKKRYNKELDTHKSLIYKLLNDISDLKEEVQYSKEELKLISSYLGSWAKNSSVLLGIEKGKNDKNVFVFLRDNSIFKKSFSAGRNLIFIDCVICNKSLYENIDIVLKLSANYVPTWLIEDVYKIDDMFVSNINEVFINDIQCIHGDTSIGYGTIALKYLEKIARLKNVRYLKGDLSYVDLSTHKERLLAFYKKNGFEIYLNEKEDDGKVVKELTTVKEH